MKKIFLVFIIISLQSCFYGAGAGGDDSFPEPQSAYKAIFMDRTEFVNSIKLEDAKSNNNVGKIYIYSNLIFVNEKNKGFHIYDNSNPANPIAINYINAPGGTDMIIKNNSIYINQATDLIAITLNTSTQNLELTKRIENVFPELLSPDGFYESTPSGKVLIEWILK